MRKFLLAAVAVSAVAGASAVAQNATPTNPDAGSAATTDKMNSSTTQGGAAMGANPASAPKAVTQDVPKNGPSFVNVQNTDMLSSNVVGSTSIISRTTASARSRTSPLTRRSR
jgi:hypothetical protein